jgi:thymidine kinase
LISDLKNAWKNTEDPHYNEIHSADTILINEGQFFKGLYDTVLEMVEKENKEVHICGLDGDFKRNIFGEILELIPYCDHVEKLTSLCASCKDGKPGLFSHRITSENEQIVVGADNYKPLCRKCYMKMEE